MTVLLCALALSSFGEGRGFCDDFSHASLSGWGGLNGSSAAIAPHGGRADGAGVVMRGGERGGGISRAFPAAQGTYEYVFWSRSVSVTGAIGVRGGVEFYDKNGRFVHPYFYGSPEGKADAAGWEKTVVRVPRVPTNAATIRVFCQLAPNSTGTAYFDDISFRPAVSPLLAVMTHPAHQTAAPGDTIRMQIVHADGAPLADAPNRRVRVCDAEGAILAQGCSVDGGSFSFVLPERRDGPCPLAITLDAATPPIAFPLNVRRRPCRTTFDAHGRMLVDGTPFMPLGFFSSSAFDARTTNALALCGANVLLSYRSFDGLGSDVAAIRRAMACLDDMGVKTIFSIKDVYPGVRWSRTAFDGAKGCDAVVEKVVTGLKDARGLLAWYLNDEMSFSDMLVRRRDAVAALDPDHPAFAEVYQNEVAPAYRRTSDVFGVCCYPVGTNAPAETALPLDETARGVAAFSRESTPVWGVPQCHSAVVYGKSGARTPTEEEMRTVALHFAGLGCKGFLFYCLSDMWSARQPNAEAAFAAHLPEVRRVFALVKSLEPWIMSRHPVERLAAQGNVRAYRLRNDAGERRILLVGGGPGRCACRLRLGGAVRSRFGRTARCGDEWVFSGEGLCSDVLEESDAPAWPFVAGREYRRLPLDVLPENAFLWYENGDFEEDNRDLMRERLDTLMERGTFNVFTLSLRCRPELGDAETFARVGAFAERARSNGVATVMDVDPRIARREFLTRWPNETQRFVQYAVVTARHGVARFTLESDRVTDHMAGGARDYSGWKAPRLFSAAAFRLDATGKALPASRRDVRRSVTTELCGTDLLVGSVAGLAEGEVLVVAAEFELFEADVFSPRLVPFTRELVARYARLPIQSVMRDEWGFAAPRKAMREHRAFWFSPHFAAAYARNAKGRDYRADLELLALPMAGREKERHAAIDAYMRTIYLRCAETECDFYDDAKATFGAKAHVAKHPTWWTGFNSAEALHNGIDWWAARRDWAQSDESVPLPVANALAKKFGGATWLNECYAPTAQTYAEAVWRYAVGGGRVVYHPLFGAFANRPFAEQARLASEGLVTPALVAAQARVRLVNLVTEGQPDAPVAVFFGHARLVNWDDPAYLDWGEAFVGGLMKEGYYADLYPADEFGASALTVDREGYVRMGRQRYAVCCLRRLGREDAAAFAKWRKGRALKTRFVSWDSPEADGVEPLSADDAAPLVAWLRAKGATRQTPPDEQPFGIAGGWQGAMTPPDGTLRLTDGTVVRYKGCRPDPAGDAIGGTLETPRGTALYEARGVFAVRFDAEGRVEALAAGGLKRVEANGLSLRLETPRDLALVRRGNTWQGVLQATAREDIPSALRALTPNWSVLRIPPTR